MLNFDEGEDVYFDSIDSLSSGDSFDFEEGSVVSDTDYEIWMKEPQSVTERRDKFFGGMEFVESSPMEEVALSRMVDCSGTVVSTLINCSSFVEENLVSTSREGNSEANSLLDELDQNGSDKSECEISIETTSGSSCSDGLGYVETHNHVNKKKSTSWWKCLMKMQIQNRESNQVTPKTNTFKAGRNNKKCMELSAMYVEQEIQAHNGFIWAMKFSPDGQFLASGGEDGVVRIWRVTTVEASSKCLANVSNFGTGRKKSKQASVVIPDKMFQIEESPLQEFHGHTDDVLDLAWSQTNCLLSSSKDKTVRLWQVGSEGCLNVFRHNNYVTCIQFNPVDDTHFISGSIDEKVRIWSVPNGRVVDWADVHDVVTAISYQPDGKGFVVGSLSGTCRFYESSGNQLQFGGQILSLGKNKTSGNKITGIKFSQEDHRKVMITSEDSKVRIFDGMDIVHKYKGLRNSGSQMSASFTSSGKHIVSVGEDSRVYVWNYGGFSLLSSKQTKKSVRSCEYFFSEGVSVAVPWSGMDNEQQHRLVCSGNDHPCCWHTQDYTRDSERFSLGSWFSSDGTCKGGSATWPEEKLPLCDLPVVKHGQLTSLSDTWGLVIVTASWDGRIRTLHNYGLPVPV